MRDILFLPECEILRLVRFLRIWNVPVSILSPNEFCSDVI